MKTFFKYLIITFLVGTLGFTGIKLVAIPFFQDKMSQSLEADAMDFPIFAQAEPKDPNLFKNSKKLNVLLLGVESEERTDTIMVASYDVKDKTLDLISLPRDTYYEREGYYDAFLKLNSVYQDKKKEYATAYAVSEILQGMPINYFAKIDYDGVAHIVDSIGGVEIDVPMDMNYEDPTSDPPLAIHIKKGKQVLDGQTAIEFLRFRSGYTGGDLDRIKTQQMFVKEALKQSLSLKLPAVIKTIIENTKTDMPLSMATKVAASASDFNMDNMNTFQIAGESDTQDGLSFFFPDEEGIFLQLTELYSNAKEGEKSSPLVWEKEWDE